MARNQRNLSGTFGQHKRMAIVDLCKLPYAVVLIESFVWDTRSVALTLFGAKSSATFTRLFACSRGWCDRFISPEVVGSDLHDSPFAVRHQNVFVAVLPIRNHFERLITVTKFSDRSSGHLATGLQSTDRNLYKRCTSIR